MPSKRKLPTEILEHIVSLTPFTVLLDMVKAKGVIGTLALARVKILVMEKEGANPVAVNFKNSFIRVFTENSIEELVFMFEESIKMMCVVCQRAWSDFSHPTLKAPVCATCFCSRDELRLVPMDSLNKEQWLPVEEMTSRDLLFAVSMSKAFYQSVKDKSWPRYWKHLRFCSSQSARAVKKELFGPGTVTRAERKKLFIAYGRAHAVALREKWTEISLMGPHWETVIGFVDDHGIKQADAFMSRVLSAYKRDAPYSASGIFRSKFHRYGNAMISSLSRWKGTVEEAHRLCTRRCCELSFPRENRAAGLV